MITIEKARTQCYNYSVVLCPFLVRERSPVWANL